MDLSNATNLSIIKYSAFYANQISSLDLSNATNLTTIEDTAFSINQICYLKIPSSLTYLSGFGGNQISSFDGNPSALIIPSNVKEIGSNAFSGNLIDGLVIRSGVTKIGFNAFNNNQMSMLDLNNATDLITISSYAFNNNKLTNLKIPSSVTTIGDYSFASNSTLSTILIKRTKEDFLANVTTGSSWYSGSPTITYKP